MEMGLAGKAAIVTGSNKGIGRGIAVALAQEGCDVVLTGRDTAALDEVAGRIRGLRRKAVICPLDLRDAGAEKALVAAAKTELGRLDILVNNAGTTKRGEFLEMSDADWQDGFALKFFAHVRLTRAAWPLLSASKGAMIVIAGTSGRKPHHDFAIGSTVNAACASFAKAMADLGKRDGVRVNAIHPSFVATDRLARRVKVAMEKTGQSEAQVLASLAEDAGFTRFGTVDDVADLVVFLVSGRSTWVHGATIDLDGGEIPVL